MSHPAIVAADLSAERQEHRYVLASERAQAFARALNGQLSPHRFIGLTANTLPRPQHFVTTIYFDTRSRHAYRAVSAGTAGEQHVKLRAREYYDLHPSLMELATSASHIVKRSPGVWMELKFRHGQRTGKRRLGIPKRHVPELLSHVAPARAPGPFRSGEPLPEAPDYTPAPQSIVGATDSDGIVLDEVRAFCALYPEPLAADSVVHYRRLPWQDTEGGLRVTMDLGVEFFAPPVDLWRREQTLVRDSLGTPKGRFERAIIEIKCRNAPPGWLVDLLGKVGAQPSRVSKFEEASRAVHGVAD